MSFGSLYFQHARAYMYALHVSGAVNMQGFVWKKFNALFRYIFISFIIHALYQCYTYSHVSLPNLCALRCLPHLNLCLLVDGVQAIYNMLGNAITDVNIDTPKERTVKIFSKMDTNN